jgi:hypothetical protein
MPDGQLLQLDPTLATLLKANFVTYLRLDILQRLERVDPLAARLWIWLESHKLDSKDRMRRLKHRRRSTVASVGQLLRIDGWTASEIHDRVQRAVTTLVAADPRYRIRTESSARAGARPGEWIMHYHKRPNTTRAAKRR